MRDHELLDFLKWHIPHMNQLSMLTWMSICTKMKTNRVHTSLSPQSDCRRSSLLPFHLCSLDNMKWKPRSSHRRPLNSWWTLQTKEEQQIFLVFSNLRTRTKGNKQTKQNLFGFSYSKLAIANKAKQMQETKINKWWRETTEIFLVFLCFRKETKQKQENEN